MKTQCLQATILCIVATTLTGQEPAKELPSVSVTATKFDTPLSELATPIHILHEEDLQQSGGLFILDALRTVPGVIALPQGGIHGNHTLRLRGLSVEQNVILIDGVEMNNSASLGASFDFGNLTSAGIERIEVLHGPQSSLYGADAIGGVIHVITKKGQEGEPQNSFSLKGGSFGTFHADMNVGGHQGDWQYHFSAQHYRSDGISSAAAGTEKDSYEQNAGNLWLRWQQAENFALEAQVRMARNTSEFDAFDFSGNAIDDLDNIEKDLTTIYSITPIAELLDGKWESKLPLSISVTDNKTVDDWSAPRKLENTQPKAAWINRFHLNEQSKLTLGAEIESEEATINNVSTFSGTEPTIDRSLESHAFYGLLQYSPLQSLRFEVSGRSDITDHFGSEDTYRGAAAWSVLEDTRIRAAYGTGFNTPTIALLYSSWGNPDLQAETSESYEFGVDHSFTQIQTDLSLTWFHNDVTDLITWDNNAFHYSNIDAVETEGIEVSATWKPLDFAHVDLSYTYTDAINQTTGNDLGRTPEHIFAGSVSGSFLNDQLHLNLETLHYGQRFDGNANDNPMPSHTIWNLSARYFLNKDVHLHARIDNLFDKDYQYVRGYNTSPLAAYVGATFFF